MNSTLSAGLIQADGRYLSNEELQPLARYTQTFAARLVAYSILRDQADQFVLQALQKLAATDGPTVQQHADVCKRDMSYVVRMLALFVLRDDERAWREQLVLWMQNIMGALHKDDQTARAYRGLQEVLRQHLSPECMAIVNPYLVEFIQAMTTKGG